MRDIFKYQVQIILNKITGFILFTKNIQAKLKQKFERFRPSMQPFSKVTSLEMRKF